jgi:hypothetical protein
MKNFAFVLAGLAILGGLYYFARHNSPAAPDAQGRLAHAVSSTAPLVKTICVEPIQNLAHRDLNLLGADDELVAQLQKAGFSSSRKISSDGAQCDAFVNAELVEISGHGRKTARIDFRLTLNGETPPRISATATGKSDDGKLAKFASHFRPAEAAPQDPEHDAISAALSDQANQILTAYHRGLPAWLPPGQ